MLQLLIKTSHLPKNWLDTQIQLKSQNLKGNTEKSYLKKAKYKKNRGCFLTPPSTQILNKLVYSPSPNTE